MEKEKNKELKSLENTDIHEWSFYETKESAGFDLRSSKDVILQPYQRVLISTGVYINEMDLKLAGQVYSKSGIAYKYGVVVFNAPGIIDADYKEEIKVLLMNHSKENYVIKRGDAIAQMGFVKMFKADKNKTNKKMDWPTKFAWDPILQHDKEQYDR
ncbi:deoxyuridine 5'-triphosphate nucleotidohydrolase-like [Hydra vulgaris]|uniref:Deoxyuridine 5'-triphosphate nucleotidohydrolase n=1 Tax=Hydra vulgaris TaxID=6087 RepID=A0ABM4BUF5_HYDVU